MNKTIYFPAYFVPQLKMFKDNLFHKYTNKSFKIYEKDSVFNYNYLLISAGHNYKKETKKDLNYDLNRNIVLGDSGGFQLATGVLKYENDIVGKIFNWLENNTNYAINLDFPPYVSNENSKKNFSEHFKEKIKISVKNFEYFQNKQTGKTKYLNVLHGRDKEKISLWYDSVKDFSFAGGWALGGCSVNLFYILYSFFFLFSKGEIEKNNNKQCLIHILGYSKLFSLPYIFYLQKKLNDLGLNINISFDSSIFTISAGFGRYGLLCSRDGIKYMCISNKINREKRKINLDVNLPCQCPVCKAMKFSDLLGFVGKRGTGLNIDFYNYVAMHNLYKFLDYKNIMENTINVDEKELYESVFNSKDFIIFNLIDRAFEEKDPLNFILRNRDVISEIDNSKEEVTTNLNKFAQF